MQSIESQPTFRRNISPPSSWSKNKLSKISAPTCLLHASFLLPYSTSLNMEVKYYSETSVDFQLTTGVMEDGTLHNHRCENLKSKEYFFVT
jgi:hypothetical protein